MNPSTTAGESELSGRVSNLGLLISHSPRTKDNQMRRGKLENWKTGKLENWKTGKRGR
jgi:hypothetical protein